MIASEGVCKALWLKEAIKLLVWVILGKKIAFRFACLTTLSNFKLHPHLVSFVLRLSGSTLGERSVLLLLLFMWPFSCHPHFQIHWRGALID